MIYRILTAPPGYPAEARFWVCSYGNLDFDSGVCILTREDGEKFAATLEEARRMIPKGAVRLPFEPKAQFIELWEA
jgi:hypothetical protein